MADLPYFSSIDAAASLRLQVDDPMRETKQAGVPVLTFVSCRGGFGYECQNQRDTSNHMILVWL